MPWCEQCARHLEDGSLGPENRCPGCGQVLVEARRVPWHFKLLLLATVVYLGWRLVQGIVWVVHHL